ncbi:MAG: methyltransferase domain-containing protein [Pseudomonadota bacterium]
MDTSNTFWDQRYDREDYLFGTSPAAFLTGNPGHLPGKGSALCVADGEGRNSVWLAGRGLNVTAFDQSQVALGKARELAVRKSVQVDFKAGDVGTWDWDQTFDAVIAVFVQFVDPAARPAFFDDLKRAVRPGGVLYLHGYTPEQLGYGTGGPPCAENMYTEAMLQEAFGDWELLRLAAYEAILDEGNGHSGRSALIDLIARRP